MTTVEILEGPDRRLFLHLDSKGDATALIPVTDKHINHLEITVENPTPFERRGDMPLEVLVGGDGRYIHVDIEGVMSVLVPVEDDKDLEWLKQTIRSPHPLRREESSINQA